ncbi:CheR family methyltransferase [Camelliibacillus cellulosilyticus]|uniref:protein-glutamate O-methyltransferase n=1 Tax=Camelliibacillus cellulosilyticus TaxID=2174486 RepID=A0ABV9GII4_9BACL
MEDGYTAFKRYLYGETGIDLSLYKEEQMKRRLASLKNKYHASSFDAFFRMMQQDPAIMADCLDRLTINVTEFFRNKSRWDVLENELLPDLKKIRTGRLKVWSAACSTGEEPYSLSMLLSRHFGHDGYDIRATDVDEKVLQRARLGLYSERSLRTLAFGERHHYFHRQNEWYKIKPEWQKPIRFEKHNLLADDFGKGYDLIVCRNVFIYFTEEAKRHLYRKFSQALKPGGLLFVGSTEQIFNASIYNLQAIRTFFYKKYEG